LKASDAKADALVASLQEERIAQATVLAELRAAVDRLAPREQAADDDAYASNQNVVENKCVAVAGAGGVSTNPQEQQPTLSADGANLELSACTGQIVLQARCLVCDRIRRLRML
jgi:hypothetical protein